MRAQMRCRRLAAAQASGRLSPCTNPHVSTYVHGEAKYRGKETHQETEGSGHDKLEPNPLARRAGSVERRQEAEANKRKHPRQQARPPVLLHDLDERACDEREGGDDKREWERLDARTKRGGPHAGLEVDGKVICSTG